MIFLYLSKINLFLSQIGGYFGPMTFPTEAHLQAYCFEWFHNTFPAERGRLYHNHQNAGNKVKQAQLKAMGVVPGISDFTLINSPMDFIEMKLGPTPQSPDQKKFEAKVRSFGHNYYICRSFPEFEALIKSKLNSHDSIQTPTAAVVGSPYL